ncbi:hypothetical protein B0H17DRAFT_1128456 [Mycena rosella]|uniref:Uncharacterized protein n=1 Tax=Mycena rosella TaxID=1033263 RepID=A0AAD7DW66_MYCRO|nr:hypothetical protein B0H17DRAFT_1128456 [Mycena rosella]
MSRTSILGIRTPPENDALSTEQMSIDCHKEPVHQTLFSQSPEISGTVRRSPNLHVIGGWPIFLAKNVGKERTVGIYGTHSIFLRDNWHCTTGPRLRVVGDEVVERCSVVWLKADLSTKALLLRTLDSRWEHSTSRRKFTLGRLDLVEISSESSHWKALRAFDFRRTFTLGSLDLVEVGSESSHWETPTSRLKWGQDFAQEKRKIIYKARPPVCTGKDGEGKIIPNYCISEFLSRHVHKLQLGGWLKGGS